MESNSLPGKIMSTEQTANLLIAAGKEHWVTPRSDLVEAKGKGFLQCYWCNPVVNTASKGSDDRVLMKGKETENMDALKLKRLVDWMTEMLEEMLSEVVSNRASYADKSQLSTNSSCRSFLNPRDEVSEVIALRKSTLPPTKQIKVDPIVKSQLNEYISSIAFLYNENPFHNFEHACHVVMSARKLLSRVVKSDESTASSTAYGISSDQLTQFAIVFSALIHDVDHPGVSNGQLVIEKKEVAVMYNNKSVAEQNSITIAWDLLLQERFSELRKSIMPTDSECKHFRQLIVNAVLATDLFDRDLKELRESRWSKAFYTDTDSNSTGIVSDEDSNRRATIVIEHVIQAADVSHTMQHWHIYQKWNRHLLQEMYMAFMSGRAEKDPTIGWYDGELWFFDNYIIPLANKLKTCGVFGVSCDELLDYANRNRAEWAAKGRSIVAESVELIKSCAWNNTASFNPSGTNRSFLINAFSAIVAENSHSE
jgi:3'5'-cyclic nucleotide phosphodiesterase